MCSPTFINHANLALHLFLKALNAYEFERHAGCKTKHPNNHIYFENGKSVYAVVQELRSTPENKLFEAIEGVTGSPINQKKFRVWKGDSLFQLSTTIFIDKQLSLSLFS